VKTELDLVDCSELIRVKRNSALYELHNGDVDILCWWPNFGKKFYVFMPLILVYFMFLFKFCSSLEVDLTLDLNPRV
jgi:hypothetical protein